MHVHSFQQEQNHLYHFKKGDDKMLRKSLSVLLILSLVFTLFSVVSADGDIKVYIDGEVQVYDQNPLLKSGSTLVPLRGIFEALGAQIEWDGATQTVTGVKDDITVKLTIGQAVAYKNGAEVQLAVPGEIINGRTMVPLRFVSEALGAQVGWDGTSRTITITSVTAHKTPAEEVAYFHFIDVGQGDAILLTDGESVILVDGGPRNSGVVDYLKGLGIDTIDLMIASHAHADHIGGQIDVLNSDIKVDTVWYNGQPHTTKTFQDWLDAIENTDTVFEDPSYLGRGQGTYYGDFQIHINHPTQPASNSTTHLHDNNMVVMISYKNSTRILLTGDMETDIEKELVEENKINEFMVQLDADILKIGHHGSESSTSQELIDAVNPTFAIYQAGEGNSYGHPHQEVLDRLQTSDVTVFGNDVHGHIVIATDGEYIEVFVEEDGEIKAGDSTSSDSTSTQKETGTVDINTASFEELKRIIHINEVRAKEIIGLRAQGLFKSVDDLTRVNGIGPARIKDIKEQGIAIVKD